ncbi:MAG: FAD-linked oxidase C-terminal domain-containing protein [Anaerolineales bacterium]
MILGSEGRLGVITQAVLRVRPLPCEESFLGVLFHNWEDGRRTACSLAQAGVGLSMIRLSDALETETTLALAGRERLIKLGQWAAALLGYGVDRCLMILGISAESDRDAARIRGQALDIVRMHGGFNAGGLIGKEWSKSRFRSPYLRNTLWDMGYALDTLESAVPWAGFEAARSGTLAALRDAFEASSVPGVAFSHLSHVYADGAGFYITYIFPRAGTAGETLSRWRLLKRSASDAISASGGTISHQHGVGIDHRDDLEAEKGRLGLQLLSALAGTVDPAGILNPGKLVAAPAESRS